MKLLRIWCGPMCSAKTTGALHAARRYARQHAKVVLIRPAASRRVHEGDDGDLRTKDGVQFAAVNVSSAHAVIDQCHGSDVVWIDEPTLFNHEEALFDVVAQIRRNSIVLLSGLGATSELEPFGKSMPCLLAVADEVHWQTADCDVCHTHGTATRTLFIGAVKVGQVQVGGTERYRAACPSCWSRFAGASPEERDRMRDGLG